MHHSTTAARRGRVVAAIASTGVAALALAGCSASSDGGTGDTTITYWASVQAPSVEETEASLTPLLDEFTEETGITVELEVIPWSDLYTRILTAVSSGEAPDLVNIGNTWATSLQATGAFLEFGDEEMEAVGGADRFVQSTLALAGAEGETPTSLPLYTSVNSLYYNTEIFEENGITEAPTTWEELLSVAAQLTQDTDGDGTIDQWGLSLPAGMGSTDSQLLYPLVRQLGGDLYDADDEPTFDSDEVVEAVDQLLSLSSVMSPGVVEYTAVAPAVQDLVDGNAAMTIRTVPGAVFEASDFTDWAVAPVPTISPVAEDGEAVQSFISGTNISVFANTDAKDASLEFVEFLLSDSVQASLNATYASMPVVTAAYDDSAFQTEEYQQKLETLADAAVPMPLVSTEGQMETLLGGALVELFTAEATGSDVTTDDIRSALTSANDQLLAAG